MNRDIKFRAWDATEKKMYSPEFPWIGAGSSAADIAICLNGRVITPNSFSLDYGVAPKVPELHIMQHTGIPDIYEGDIATKTFTEKVGKYTLERTVKGEVIWSTQKAGFVLLVKEYVDDSVFNQRHYELDGCTVTGNIYE